MDFSFEFGGASRVQSLDPDAQTFIDRVIADGGTVEDASFLNAFVNDAKANNYWNDIVAAYSPSWGVKGGATASDLYSVIGVSGDLSQGTAASQPTITAAAVNGKTSLVFDGVNDLMDGTFTCNSPETVIMMGFKQITWTSADLFFDGSGGGLASGGVQQESGGVSPEILLNIGGALAASMNTDLTVNTAAHLRAKLNSPTDGAIQVDNNTETTSAAPVLKNMGGLTLGGGAGGLLFSNINASAVVLLDSAIDASYDAKMTALYNFSKSAYGTA